MSSSGESASPGGSSPGFKGFWPGFSGSLAFALAVGTVWAAAATPDLAPEPLVTVAWVFISGFAGAVFAAVGGVAFAATALAAGFAGVALVAGLAAVAARAAALGKGLTCFFTALRTGAAFFAGFALFLVAVLVATRVSPSERGPYNKGM